MQGFSIRSFIAAALIVLGVMVALPTFMPEKTLTENYPSFLPKDKINLGLDLQGGGYLVYELQTEKAQDSNLKDIAQELDKANANTIRVRGFFQTEEGLISFTPADAADLSKAQAGLDQELEKLFPSSREGASYELIPEGNRILIRITGDENETDTQTLERVVSVIRQRIDASGVTEPQIQTQGTDRIIIQMPGVKNVEQMKSRISTSGKMEFRLAHPSWYQGLPLPEGYQAMQGDERTNAGETFAVSDEIYLSGEDLKSASSSLHPNKGIGYVVNFTFTTGGGKAFGDLTTKYRGQRLAVVMDSKVISAPTLNVPILSGQGYIEGPQTGGGLGKEETETLAILMNGGALPVPIVLLQERAIGAQLGADSVSAGKMASLIGLVSVLIFMLLYYGRFGLFANIVLISNIFFIIAIMTFLKATLTLAGIAGIVLTIGMAVDANVLVFERIREEARRGLSPIKAVSEGYRSAFSTILDANITTLVAAVILYVFGTGPIRGFAVTLSVGVLTSMFAALFLTRLFIEGWLSFRRRDRLPLERSILPHFNIPFLSLRKLSLIISGVLLLGSGTLFFSKGLNYGIDFKGGLEMLVQTNGPADLSSLRSKLSSVALGDFSVQALSSEEDQALIRVELDGKAEAAQAAVKKTITDALGDDILSVQDAQVIGGTIAKELRQKGLWATILALGAIALYIWFRFEWQFALAALIALAHDILTTVGFFAFFQFEFNLATIAAILTIAGYSINDTVVIFDRVREELQGEDDEVSIKSLINKALNSTLARTLVTSLTTLLAVIALLVFGGESLRSLSSALIFGVIVGTYSSLFVATPLLLAFKLNRKAFDEEETQGGGEHAAAFAASERAQRQLTNNLLDLSQLENAPILDATPQPAEEPSQAEGSSQVGRGSPEQAVQVRPGFRQQSTRKASSKKKKK